MLVVAGLAGYAATAVATYFNVALVSCAARSFHGEDTSAGEGMRAANARLGSILLWALIASLVGLVIRTVEQRAGLWAASWRVCWGRDGRSPPTS